MNIIDSQEPVYRVEHEIDILDKRIKQLESLTENLYADYYDEYPDRAEEVYAECMRDLGLEINNGD